MKKIIWIVITAMGFAAGLATNGYSYRGGHGHHGSHIDFGFMIGPTIGPWWGPYPYYPYYPYYYSPPPVVIREEPQEYIRQSPSQEEPNYYWYYCPDPEGFYPYVKKCPKGWQKVEPSPQDNEE